MVIVVIGILGLLVVHAANKVTATATLAAGGDPNALPPNTAVAATGNTSTPSPATWGGAPGAASQNEIKLDTNSPWVTASDTGIGGQSLPGLPGVPRSFTPGRTFNGFDAVPANTKQLSVNRLPARTTLGSGNMIGGTKL